MDRIKGFFEEKKLDSKFKRAGEGHRLDSASSSSVSSSGATGAAAAAAPRRPPTAAGTNAACAAAARQQHLNARTNTTVTGKVFRQTSGENTAQAATAAPSVERQHSTEASAIVESNLFPVRLICPVCSGSYARSSIYEHYDTCLRSSLSREALTTSCVMIWTLTQDKEKVGRCVTTICKYLDNAIEHPGEEKYGRVRVNNKAFQERVAACTGAKEFFLAVGFESQMQGDPAEEFLVLTEAVHADSERLQMCKDILTSTEPLKGELDRCVQVFHMSASAMSFSLPPSFFRLSTEELKREQQRMKHDAEQMTQLRTKAMRDRDAQASLRHYRYCVVRVRMPDSLVLQATFFPAETISKVRHVVYSAVTEELEAYPFSLVDPSGRVVTDDTMTLSAAKWVPHALITMRFDDAQLQGHTQQVVRKALLQNIKSL